MNPDCVPGKTVMVVTGEVRSQLLTVTTRNRTSNCRSVVVVFSKALVNVEENPDEPGDCVAAVTKPAPSFSSISQTNRSTKSGWPAIEVFVKFTVRMLHPDVTSGVKLAFGSGSTVTGTTRISAHAF